MKRTIFLPVSVAQSVFKDPLKSAEAAKLVYVNDTQEGITRIRNGEGFSYRFKGKVLKDKKELDRIGKLGIPPAWTDVWICRQHNGHIQATGIDAKQRKQYKYHTGWSELRNQTKFQRLASFGEKLPQLRSQLEKDLAQKVLSIDKVLALIISLMERTYIRIGNNGYEKLYGSYGLTTLKDKHVKIEGSDIRFSFRGKKGIYHKIAFHNRKLACIVKQCREIPGKELFQYYDEYDQVHTVHSEHVNGYIRQVTGEDYTAKDFRTWAGSVHAVRSLMELGEADSDAVCKQNMIKALDDVSAKLGNTRAVCRKYYVHPLIMELYQSKALSTYLDDPSVKKQVDGWSSEEMILLNILNTKQ